MPREIRKRGKRHKKQNVEEELPQFNKEVEKTPSWVVQNHEANTHDTDAPFGLLEPDVKAYFKMVDDKIREWQEFSQTSPSDDAEAVELNEEKRLFLVAIMTEITGKEAQVACDPECSLILESVSYSMDDLIRRVFMDRLAGSYHALATHRFGSHVLQTLLTSSVGAISREQTNPVPKASSDKSEFGELPLLADIICTLCKELTPHAVSLISDPFGSHVFRALLVLLCPTMAPLDNSRDLGQSSILRSKKSAAHRAKRGSMKSIFESLTTDHTTSSCVPAKFDKVARKIVSNIRKELSDNEIRAFAPDKVACPVLLLLLNLEHHQQRSEEPRSFQDILSFGLVSICRQSTTLVEPSEYVTTLLREPVASHLMESMVNLSSPEVFAQLWKHYFKGDLKKIAVHPVANFAVARAIERLGSEELLNALTDLKQSWPKHIQTGRVGVLRSVIDRSAEIRAGEKEVCEAVSVAFSLQDVEKEVVIWHIMELTGLDKAHAKKGPTDSSKSEPTVQGCLTLQSLLKLEHPHNSIVIDSLESLSQDEVIKLACHPISSRLIDAVLDSPTVLPKTRRKFILSLIGQYHTLLDNRIGSRVVDRCWAASDPYLKEKIARSLIDHEQFLVGSQFGKYFARNLRLHVLKRSPEDWKAMQLQGPKIAGTGPGNGLKRKREDEWQQSNARRR